MNLFYEHERIGQGLQSLKGLKSLINFNSSLARDLGLNLLSVLLSYNFVADIDTEGANAISPSFIKSATYFVSYLPFT